MRAHDTCAHCTHPCYFVGRDICWVLSYRDFGIGTERKRNLCRDMVESPDVQTLIEGDAVQVPVSTSYTHVSFSLTHTHTHTHTHNGTHKHLFAQQVAFVRSQPQQCGT